MLGILVVIVIVVAIIALGTWQYRERSRPLAEYSRSIVALKERIAASPNLSENLHGILGPLNGTATGAAVTDLMVGGNHRSFSARAVINEGLVLADVPDLRRFEMVPGQFIAFGLTLTFTLLAYAIWQAAASLSAATPSLVPAMQALLTTAGIKFAVSIAAIGVSIVLVHRRTQLLVAAEEALAALATTLDGLLPLVTPSDEALALTRQQAAALARIETALLALAKPAADFPTALAEAMLPVAGSINAMGDSIAATNTEALERMVKAFTSELGGATLRYNQQLAETLRDTSEALHQAPVQIRAAAQLTEQLLDAASDKTRTALENAAKAYTGTADRLEAIASQARHAEQKLDDALIKATANADAAATRLADLTTGLEAAAAAVADTAGKAAAANDILAETARMRDTMAADTRDWTVGMDEVDRKVARIISEVRNYLPAAGAENGEASLAKPGTADPA